MSPVGPFSFFINYMTSQVPPVPAAWDEAWKNGPGFLQGWLSGWFETHPTGALGISNKLALVLNRANSGIRLAALEEQLGMPIAGTVVSAGRAVVEAANHGVSLFDQDPSEEAEVTRDMGRLVELVAGQPRPSSANGQRESMAVTAARGQAQQRSPFWRRSGR